MAVLLIAPVVAPRMAVSATLPAVVGLRRGKTLLIRPPTKFVRLLPARVAINPFAAFQGAVMRFPPPAGLKPALRIPPPIPTISATLSAEALPVDPGAMEGPPSSIPPPVPTARVTKLPTLFP
ncbi:hypothetical protein D3C74_327340 [compost metagenome]